MTLQGIGHLFRHIALFTHSAALLTEVISTAPERQQWVVCGRSTSPENVEITVRLRPEAAIQMKINLGQEALESM